MITRILCMLALVAALAAGPLGCESEGGGANSGGGGGSAAGGNASQGEGGGLACTPAGHEANLATYVDVAADDRPETDECKETLGALHGTHTFENDETEYVSALSATIEQGVLVEVDGHPCEPASIGTVSTASGCDKTYVCDCCRYILSIDGDAEEGFSIKAPFLYCLDYAPHREYSAERYYLGGKAPEPVGVGVSSDLCRECLKECADWPSGSGCCTHGDACHCKAQCQPAPSDCSSGTTFCCGPGGTCLCLSNCPY